MSEKLIDAKDYTIAAGGTSYISIPGTFFQLMESTANVTVRFFRSDSEIGVAENVPEGFTVGPFAEPFHRVQIYSASAQTIKASISRADTRLLRVTGAIDAEIVTGSTLADAADGSLAAAAEATLAADSTRNAAIISAPTTNTETLRVSKTGGDRGAYLVPGGSVTVNTKDAIKVYNPGPTAAQGYSVLYENQ